MRNMALHWQILIAIVLGCAFGFFLPQWTPYVSWMGDLFLRLLKMIVIPLVFCALVSAVNGIRGEGRLSRLGAKAVGMYLLSSTLAICVGLLLVNLIRPGESIDVSDEQTVTRLDTQTRPLRETLLNMVPENPFSALAQADMLPIVIFAILFAIFLARTRREESLEQEFDDLPDRESTVEVVVRFFDGAYRVILNMTVFIMSYAAFGVFGLIAKNVALFAGDAEMIAQLGRGLGLHFLVVFSGLSIHLLLTLSFCMWLIGKCNPWKHLRNSGTVLLTAFSTASSNATLPVTLQSVVEKDGVSEETAGFVLPLGATVNMDGTSLYECAVVLFVAQAYGIELTLFQQLITVLMVLLTAVGTAGIPMASLVMIVVVLNSVGLPPEGIGLVLAVDRPLDMCRTAVNVYGDTCCAVIVAKSEGESLNI